MPVPVVGFRLREYCLFVALFQCSCTPRLPKIAVLPAVGRYTVPDCFCPLALGREAASYR
jgi:hypothetical protein